MIRMHNRSSRGTARRSGTATLEMAISLTLLFNICFGLVEFGWYFFVKNTLENCAREGCRASIVSGAVESDVTSAVLAQLKAANLIASTATAATPYTIATTPNDIATQSVGGTVSCTVSGTWGTVATGFRPLSILPTTKVVSGACSMRKEG